MGQHQSAARPGPGLPREIQDRLLRALTDLRELERERQAHRAASRPTDELSRRLEAKAREVFRLGREAEVRPDRPS